MISHFDFGRHHGDRHAEFVLQNYDRKLFSFRKWFEHHPGIHSFPEKIIFAFSIASFGEFTENTPMLEPPLAGFTIARGYFVFFKKFFYYFRVVG